MQIDKKIYGFMYNRISKEIYDKPAVVNPDMVEGQFIMGTDSIPAMYQSISKHNLTGLYEKKLKKIAEFLYKKIRPANAGRTYDNTQ